MVLHLSHGGHQPLVLHVRHQECRAEGRGVRGQEKVLQEGTHDHAQQELQHCALPKPGQAGFHRLRQRREGGRAKGKTMRKKERKKNPLNQVQQHNREDGRLT